MNNRTEQKLTDLSGMEKAVKDILKQAWIRGVRYGIEQSKEDNSKGDTISREALKKAIEQIAQDYVDDNFFWAKLFDLIDNAPTVKPEKAKEGEIIKAYKKGFDTGVEIAITERQQGEWYEEQFTSCGSILQMRLNVIQQRCSKCERWSIKWEGTIPSNYCSHCGAKMKTDKGNEND